MRKAAIFLLKVYKGAISPLLPPSCRFTPTCSEYAMEAIAKYGVLKGSGMGARRLLRCHPFSPGGYDPVR
jgi:putative membrane protein insertion efficiency factor